MAKRGSSDGNGVQERDATVTSLAARRKPPSRKGIPATPKQLEVLKRGTESRRAASAKLKKERAAGTKKPKSRWKQLLAGELTVADLETEELQRQMTRDALGAFTSARTRVPPRIAREMKSELLRRGQAMIDTAYTDAVTLLHDVVRDKKAKHADRIKAASLIVERSAGRLPETVRIDKGAAWDETFEDGVVVITNKDEETA